VLVLLLRCLVYKQCRRSDLSSLPYKPDGFGNKLFSTTSEPILPPLAFPPPLPLLAGSSPPANPPLPASISSPPRGLSRLTGGCITTGDVRARHRARLTGLIPAHREASPFPALSPSTGGAELARCGVENRRSVHLCLLLLWLVIDPSLLRFRGFE
jgi:hypothetical protein